MALLRETTQEALERVAAVCQRYGSSSLIALSGVPGTGKSYIGALAAAQVAGDSRRVREIQFHPSFSYEQFVEGMRIRPGGGADIEPGVLLEWNDRALADPSHTYVLLIEELTRANLPSVLGELLTYIEYRGRPFYPLYSRLPTALADNLVLLATYNPTDRSALDLDAALVRRLRVVPFQPSTAQLEEMLSGNGVPTSVIERISKLFEACVTQFGDRFESLMPFGHGVFSEVRGETPDLFDLWRQRIVHLLRRPLELPHPFTDVIEANYPWRQKSSYRLEAEDEEATAEAGGNQDQAAEGTAPYGEEG